MNPIRLNQGGYFERAGRRLVPVGANYWPASCGVELWQAWPEHEIAHDLAVLRGLGLNTIRFFLRWQDFEPEAGRYDATMFDRLRRFLKLCAEHDVLAHPSLFVGFMSGGVFWPKWRQGRNVFADAFMLQRGVEFARKAAEVIAPFAQHVLAIDQGNELCCLRDSSEAPPAAVRHWCASINSAIREVYRQAILISGNEQNQVLNDTGWRFGRQDGCDLYSMHGYPVPAWHSVGFDGMTDPLCQSLLPLYTKIARAFGPVMVQEFGTIVTFGAQHQDAYLRGMLPAAWEAGGNGFLWWCLRDIRANVHPYVKNGFEGTLGLIDDQDRVKPGLEYFIEFCRSLADRPAPAIDSPDGVGIYWPKHFYPRDEQENPGNQPRHLSRWIVMANHMLQQLGHPTRIIRSDLPLDPALKTLVIPGAMIDQNEAAAIERWVRAGGRLIWHGPDPVNWGHAFIRLVGARPVDYRACRPSTVRAFGGEWRFEHYPRNMRVEVIPETAKVVADDDRGLAAVLSNALGKGHVTAALPLVDESIAEVAPDRDARDRWPRWYEAVLLLTTGQ